MLERCPGRWDLRHRRLLSCKSCERNRPSTSYRLRPLGPACFSQPQSINSAANSPRLNTCTKPPPLTVGSNVPFKRDQRNSDVHPSRLCLLWAEKRTLTAIPVTAPGERSRNIGCLSGNADQVTLPCFKRRPALRLENEPSMPGRECRIPAAPTRTGELKESAGAI